jgi:histidine triad (HIT) family protein
VAATKARAGKACRFCEIVEGRAKAYRVFSDDVSVAFLDYRPLALGHVLLVPRAHHATPAETPDDVMAAFGTRLKLLSSAVVEAMRSEGSFIGLNNVVSQSVPHLHFHVVPRWKDDRLFSQKMVWRRVAYRDDAEREEVAQRIRAAIGSRD